MADRAPTHRATFELERQIRTRTALTNANGALTTTDHDNRILSDGGGITMGEGRERTASGDAPQGELATSPRKRWATPLVILSEDATTAGMPNFPRPHMETVIPHSLIS